MDSAMYFFGGAADLFLSVMLWFILDEEEKPKLFVDADRVYVVQDVIKTNHNSVNIDCEDSEQEEDNESRAASLVSLNSSLTSKLMINMFLSELEESPEQDWI